MRFISGLNLVQQAILVHGLQAVALVALGVWVDNRVVSGDTSFLIAITTLALLSVGSATFIAHRCAQVLGPATAALEAAQSLDFSGRVATHRTDEPGKIAAAMGRAFDSITRAFGEVRSATNYLSAAASSITDWAKEADSIAHQQTQTIDATISSLEAANAGVTANADHARQAHQLALRSREVAEAGGLVIRSTVVAMGEIKESSDRIREIANTIDEISFQTNLLALNAAVEAARAGDAGRGFAVVASEVRALAQRSATAAREVKTLINESVSRAKNGSRLATNAGTTFEDVIVATRRVADIVAELSAGLVEQGTALVQAGSNVRDTQRKNTQVAEAGAQLVTHADALRVAITTLTALTDTCTGLRAQPALFVMPTAYTEDEVILPRREDRVPPPRRVSSDSVDFSPLREEPPSDRAFEES